MRADWTWVAHWVRILKPPVRPKTWPRCSACGSNPQATDPARDWQGGCAKCRASYGREPASRAIGWQAVMPAPGWAALGALVTSRRLPSAAEIKVQMFGESQPPWSWLLAFNLGAKDRRHVIALMTILEIFPLISGHFLTGGSLSPLRPGRWGLPLGSRGAVHPLTRKVPSADVAGAADHEQVAASWFGPE